jgi:Family of unknown function (DUF6427)
VTGIFKSNNLSGNFYLFLYAVVLKFPMFMHLSNPQLQPLDGIFYKLFLQFFTPIAKAVPFIYSVFTFALLFIQAISFNKIVNTQRLIKQSNYLTGMSYLLITSLFTDWFVLSAPLIVNTIMIWIWARLCTLYNNPAAKSTIFNMGLATGIAAFFYFPSITFLILIMAGIAISRPFRLQEWLLGLAGIITPVYLFAAFLFLTGKTKTYQFPGFHFSYPHFMGNKWAYAALIMLIMATAVGFYFINSNMRRQVVNTRKSWQLLFLYLIVAALVPFFNASINFSYWILLAVPLSPIIAAAFFYPQKKIIPALLHWAMVALFVIVNFLHLKF